MKNLESYGVEELIQCKAEEIKGGWFQLIAWATWYLVEEVATNPVAHTQAYINGTNDGANAANSLFK